jgi:hypothetical protein
VQRYLSALGSWSSYRDLSRPEQLPQRLADLTAAYFGLAGFSPAGFPQVTGLLGAVMAVHALEQVTAGLATFGTRLLVRGEPLGHHRGVVWRRSPLTPRTARALRWLIGSRLISAEGCYFTETGRTWHSQTVSLHWAETHRTLTHLAALSLPRREFYFDRAVAVPSLIDLVKGDRAADALPGFIGGINELEQIAGLAYFKRAFIAAGWLLIEPEERDDGSPGPLDYDALIKGTPPGGGGGYARPFSPGPFSRPADYASNRPGSAASAWPSPGSAGASRPLVITNGLPRSTPLRPAPEPVPPDSPPPDDPFLRIKARYHAPDGTAYPLLIRRLTTHPITLLKKADAIFYDSQSRRWREINDDETRLALAREVEAGRLAVSPDWQRQL